MPLCSLHICRVGGGCWLADGLWQGVWVLIEYRGRAPQVAPSSCLAPTAVVMENAPREVGGYVAAARIVAWTGRDYGWELTESPGIRDSAGAVRVGLVHCNDRSDVGCLPEAVAGLDGNRECCGDLPG